MLEPHKEIAELEAAIDRLSGTAENCREIMRISRAAIGFGLLLFAAALSGFFPLRPLMFVLSIPFALGGFIAFGSNKSTREEALEEISAHEARRADLIDHFRMRDATPHLRVIEGG